MITGRTARAFGQWALLAAMVLAPRLALIAAESSTGRQPEAFEYETLARNVLEGRGYVYPHLGTDYFGFHSAVPYVLLTASVYRLSSDPRVAMAVAQSAMSLLLVGIILALGSRLAGPWVGWVAAGLVALHPGLLYYDTHKLHPLSFDALMLSSATLALWRWFERPSIRRSVAAGLLGGVALLERGSFLPVILASLAGIWRPSRDRRAALTASAALIVGAGLVVGPWLLRNTRHFGTPLLMTTSGEHLWRGNHQGATGTSLTLDGRPVLEAAPAEFREALFRRDELGQMRLFLEESGRYVAAHPWQALGAAARRFGYFLWRTPTAGTGYPALYGSLYQLYYAGLLLASLLGVARLAAAWRAVSDSVKTGVVLLIGVWGSVGLVHSLSYIELRHRWGVEALMVVFSAAGLRELMDRFVARSQAR
jgi:hypothetical protein